MGTDGIAYNHDCKVVMANLVILFIPEPNAGIGYPDRKPKFALFGGGGEGLVKYDFAFLILNFSWSFSSPPKKNLENELLMEYLNFEFE